MKRFAQIAFALAFLSAAAHAEERAVIDTVTKEWQNAYGAIIYTVLVNVTNVSNAPVQYVKVRVELFDKDAKSVTTREGYNVGAEILDDPDTPGSAAEKLQRVKPIAPGGTDLVRLSLDKADIGKPFRTAQVSIVEVK